jgi:hypothetical protein
MLMDRIDLKTNRPADSSEVVCFGDSLTPDGRYSTSGSIVFDNQTSLSWERCAVGMLWSGSTCEGNPELMSWNDAAKKFPLSGSDWRLPNIDELMSLRSGNDGKGSEYIEPIAGCWKPGINEVVFPNVVDDYFWSSSKSSRFDAYVWVVGFSYSNLNVASDNNLYAVRLVRGNLYRSRLMGSDKVRID